MKVKTALKKIVDSQFQETLSRVMKKWPEAKDVHALVKIASAHEHEVKLYQETIVKIEDHEGFQLDGRKSTNPQEITNYLLQEFGKMAADGNMTMVGASQENLETFLEQKKIAETCMHKFNTDHKAVVDSEIEFEFPRLLVVEEKHIRKEIITAQDCFILEPILDLSKISDLKAEPQPE